MWNQPMIQTRQPADRDRSAGLQGPQPDMAGEPTRAEETRQATRPAPVRVVPAVDIYESGDGLQLVADLPGADREDLELRLDNGVLTLRCRRRMQDPGARIHAERRTVEYGRDFRLPRGIDVERVSASLQDGVLTVQLPKADAARPRRIDVRGA